MTTAEAIAATQLFKSVSTQSVDWVTERLRERHFDAGQRIFDQGDAATGLFIVRSGEVRIVASLKASGEPIHPEEILAALQDCC